jgi:plasmid stability protein
MMVRTQISLDSEQHRKAKLRAAERGISLAQYLRELLQRDLGEESRPKAHISEIFGIGSSGEPTDIARDKDRLIADAAWAEYLRETGREPKE